jgi:hypothetical protein
MGDSKCDSDSEFEEEDRRIGNWIFFDFQLDFIVSIFFNIFFFLLILVSVVNSKNLLMGSESLCLSSEKSEEENKVQNC